MLDHAAHDENMEALKLMKKHLTFFSEIVDDAHDYTVIKDGGHEVEVSYNIS